MGIFIDYKNDYFVKNDVFVEKLYDVIFKFMVIKCVIYIMLLGFIVNCWKRKLNIFGVF